MSNQQPTEAERVAELHREAASAYAAANSPAARIEASAQRAEAVSNAQAHAAANLR
ncbi:hypothetical protein ACFWZY_01645 [Streptomyces sp. NPDC058992]|uniref:hypothetical protein n=1 Tax=Streptomyces sp. NPDC058992 TaxID=3346688 RepID=UPI0036CA8E27